MSAPLQTMTFVHEALDASEIAAELAAAGYETAGVIRRRRTLLDSFDGRLFAAGITLEHVEPIAPAGHAHLAMSMANSLPATSPVRRCPRFASDLPAGPFRERLATPLERRAMTPITSFIDSTIEVAGRDSRDNITVRATVHAVLDTIAGDHSGIALAVVEAATSPGHERAARDLAVAIRQLGGRPATSPLVDLVCASRGIDRTGYDSSPDADLDRDITALAGFRIVFANLARTIEANLAGTIDDVDVEFLHEFRVAIRRTRSVLGLGKDVISDAARQHYRDEFAWLAGITGPLRDLDVYITEWDQSVGHLAVDRIEALRPVLMHLQQHRASALRTLVDDLRSPRAEQLMTGWEAGLADLEPGPDAGRRLREIVGKRIAKANATVLANGRRIDVGSPAEALHDLRKDAKKLRYAVECFGGLLPAKRRRAFVRQLKGLQDNLGRHQDAEVHSAELQVVARELSTEHATPSTLLALGQLIEHLELEKVAARAEFAERFAAFDSAATVRIVTDLLRSLDR